MIFDNYELLWIKISRWVEIRIDRSKWNPVIRVKNHCIFIFRYFYCFHSRCSLIFIIRIEYRDLEIFEIPRNRRVIETLFDLVQIYPTIPFWSLPSPISIYLYTSTERIINSCVDIGIDIGIGMSLKKKKVSIIFERRRIESCCNTVRFLFSIFSCHHFEAVLFLTATSLSITASRTTNEFSLQFLEEGKEDWSNAWPTHCRFNCSQWLEVINHRATTSRGMIRLRLLSSFFIRGIKSE